MQLRMQLAPMKKNELSATDYFNRVKNLADNLAAAGAPLREDEIVAYILTRLLGEYDSLVTFVMTRAEPMSLSEVYTNLLSFEARLCEPQCPPSPLSWPYNGGQLRLSWWPSHWSLWWSL
jgi:hypothetical protein